MGKYLKQFCDKQRKLVNGHVPNVIDMEESDKDAAIVACLRDEGLMVMAAIYPSYSNDDKNDCYSSLEEIIQGCIAQYNEAVDVMRELAQPNASELSAFCPERYPDHCPVHGHDDYREPLNVNQDCEDAGHKPENFC